MVRIFLNGRVAIERHDATVTGSALGGPQSAALLAMLAIERGHAVSADEIADHLWPDALPRAWPQAIRSLTSKLRRHLAASPTDDPISHWMGCYQLRLAPTSWVDAEHARTALHDAEHHLRGDRLDLACGQALVASCITREQFLPGWSSAWSERQRAILDDVRARALECLSEVWLRRGDPTLAIRDAAEVIRREPFRERAYRQLMRAHAAAGSRSEALKVFDDLRRLLSAELATAPSTETIALAGRL